MSESQGPCPELKSNLKDAVHHGPRPQPQPLSYFSKATLAGELYYQKEEDGIPQNLLGLNFLPFIR